MMSGTVTAAKRWASHVMLGPPLPPPSAESLIEAVARSQDREAFSRLYLHYGPKLKAFAMSLGASSAVAEEVVQDSLLNVWRRAGQFDPARGTGTGWLFSIARNTFISQVRRQRSLEVDPDDPAFVVAPSPEQQVASRQSEEQLRHALAALPAEQAAVLRSAYGQGLALSEIAQQQNLPLGTVKTRARLAMEKLRVVFGAKESS